MKQPTTAAARLNQGLRQLDRRTGRRLTGDVVLAAVVEDDAHRAALAAEAEQLAGKPLHEFTARDIAVLSLAEHTLGWELRDRAWVKPAQAS